MTTKEIERLRRKLASIERFAETGNMFEAMFGTPVSRAGQRGTKTQNSDANCPERDNTTHDAVPEARANAESVAPQPTAGDRSGNPTSHSGTGNTSDRPQPVKDDVSDRSQPISDERLAALEELSALDQDLELKHGITGNPMIKPQVNNHPEPYAKHDEKRVFYDTKSLRNGAPSGCETVPDPDSRVWETPCTPQPHATPTQGSVHGEGSLCDSRNAKEPVAWAVMERDGFGVECTFTDRDEAAEWCDGRQQIVPLFRQPPDWAFLNDEIARLRDVIRRLAEQDATLSVCDGNVTVTMDATLTDAERQAIQWVIGEALSVDGVSIQATLRGLLERTK